jgi:hypothetical protein
MYNADTSEIGWPTEFAQFALLVTFLCKCGNNIAEKFLIINKEYRPEMICTICERKFVLGLVFEER